MLSHLSELVVMGGKQGGGFEDELFHTDALILAINNSHKMLELFH